MIHIAVQISNASSKNLTLFGIVIAIISWHDVIRRDHHDYDVLCVSEATHLVCLNIFFVYSNLHIHHSRLHAFWQSVERVSKQYIDKQNKIFI